VRGGARRTAQAQSWMDYLGSMQKNKNYVALALALGDPYDNDM
jgi:hypothetical protein